MAATERDIREMLNRDRELRTEKPERHSKAGTKMAMDILNHFKFPGDKDTKPEDTDKWPDTDMIHRVIFILENTPKQSLGVFS